MPTVRAVVHIGPMKTGTTAFAAAASEAQRSGTLSAGMVYPMGALWFGDDRAVVKHHQLNLAARRVPTGRRRRAREEAELGLLEAALAGCADEARRGAAEVHDAQAAVLLVAEGLSHQTNSERLTAILGRHVDRIDYVMVARAQPRAVGSIIAHGVKDIRRVDRRRLDASAYLSGPARIRRFDYANIVENWRRDDSVLHILPFSESAPGGRSLTEAIAHAVGLPPLPVSEELAAKRTHPTYSKNGLAELARIKWQRHTFGWVPGADERYRRRFTEAWERHHRMARDGHVDRWRLPPRDVELVTAAYAESNRRFRELLGAAADAPAWREWFAVALGETDAHTTPALEEPS